MNLNIGGEITQKTQTYTTGQKFRDTCAKMANLFGISDTCVFFTSPWFQIKIFTHICVYRLTYSVTLRY